MEIQERQGAVLDCKFTIIGRTPYVFWYSQRLGRDPQYIVKAYKTNPQLPFTQGKFSTTLHAENNTATLKIDGVSLQDAEVYFCALSISIGYSKLTFGSGTRLVVTPNLQKSEPSVYELESTNKSHPLSACLFTDYFPGNINVSATGSNLVGIESSVVVVEDQASYGAVLWQNANENLQCIANYDGEDIQAKKDIADSCSGTQMSFQTDERLNLLSLTVLGLRVIFFKSVAVNLLLTFRLWSR
nr:TRAV19.1 [Sphenodon punctatus]